YYVLKLNDREVAVNQFTGDKLSEVKYPMTELFVNLSLDLHTGRSSIIWAIILGAAAVNILFFIYSGFIITWRRTRGRIHNKCKPDECKFIILVGSENGTTMRFAGMVQQQLIKNGERAYLTELNNFKSFPNAEHIVVLTATYGLGDAPSNAKKFNSILAKYNQPKQVRFSVVAFGSLAYPDFCRFGFDVHNLLSAQPWATPLLDIHTVNDKSPEQFLQWYNTWSSYAELPISTLPVIPVRKPGRLKIMRVIEKTTVAHTDGAFLLRLRPGRLTKFNSGDILAIYPANDHRERLYSIGKIGKVLQLSVRMHTGGLGSGYLYNCSPGDVIRARIVKNEKFYFPDKGATVVMICNGTGIAPFLGMIDQNTSRIDCYLFCGFRDHTSFDLYKESLTQNIEAKKLNRLSVAYSREGEKQYVVDLVKRDAAFITATLAGAGVVMICGSLAMEKNVIELLESICLEKTGRGLSFYQSRGQVLTDCY
ncbi:MAG: FAD-binding oxidoreductase, partial [Chitinophagaceae bacterium]